MGGPGSGRKKGSKNKGYTTNKSTNTSSYSKNKKKSIDVNTNAAKYKKLIALRKAKMNG